MTNVFTLRVPLRMEDGVLQLQTDLLGKFKMSTHYNIGSGIAIIKLQSTRLQFFLHPFIKVILQDLNLFFN